jgi:hypothetical protein
MTSKLADRDHEKDVLTEIAFTRRALERAVAKLDQAVAYLGWSDNGRARLILAESEVRQARAEANQCSKVLTQTLRSLEAMDAAERAEAVR